MYVPGLPYLTAALVWIARDVPPEYMYRLLSGALVCLGPATLFLMAVYFTRSRRWALAAALAYTFFSPLYGLVSQISNDRGIAQVPWRVQVWAKYGEGPHNAGLTLLPLALVLGWAAAAGRRYWQVLAAALLMAAVALTNFVAALALGLCCLLMLLCGTAEPDLRPRRLLAAAGLAYLLACFWLTPSFLGTVAFNWPRDAFGFRFGLAQALLLGGMVLGILLISELLRRRGDFYLRFVTLALFVFAWIPLSHYWFAVGMIPESRRYAPEFELFLMLALTEWLRRASAARRLALRRGALVAAAALVALGIPQAWRYSTRDRHKRYPVSAGHTIEYRIARWLADQKPAGRVFASGGLRFRLNSWFNIQQVGGGFETGLRNRGPLDLAYQIRTGISSEPGMEARDAVLELQAMGVQYVVVHGPKSREHYRDFARPREFEGLLPVAFQAEDDTVYSVPFHSLAHLVTVAELPPEFRGGRAFDLEPFVRAMQDPARPRLETAWLGPGTLELQGAVPAGMLVSVLVNHDPAWVAEQDGRRIGVERSRLGFVALRPEPGSFTRIRLSYAGTAEQRAFAALSGLAWLAALAGLLAARRVRYWKQESARAGR
jgi:hypothetical protein